MNNFNYYINNLFEAENDTPEKPIIVNSPNTTIVVKKERRKKQTNLKSPSLPAANSNAQVPPDLSQTDNLEGLPQNYYEDEVELDSPASSSADLQPPVYQSPNSNVSQNYYEDEPIVNPANSNNLKPSASSIQTIPDNIVMPDNYNLANQNQPVSPPAMVDPSKDYYEDEFTYEDPSLQSTQVSNAPQSQTPTFTPVDQNALSDPNIDIYEDDYNPNDSVIQSIGNASEETMSPPIPTKDLARIDNLKNIHSTLLNIRSILNNESDNKYKNLKSKLDDSLVYFGHIIKNLDSYSSVIDDLISKYKRFSFVFVQELNKIKNSANKPKITNNSKLKLSKQDRDLIVSDIVKKLKNK